MKSRVILETFNTKFDCNSIHYNDYELCFNEQKVAFIKGKGGIKQKNISEEDKIIIKDIFNLSLYFQNPDLVTVTEGMVNFFKEIDKVRTLKINSFDTLKSILVGDLTDMYFKNKHKEDYYKLEETKFYYRYNMNMLIVKSIGFFEKHGIPECYNTANGCNVLEFILRLNNCYLFFEAIEDLNKGIDNLVVDSPKYKLVKNNKDNKEAKNEDSLEQYKIISYFNDPFEFAKFKILISKMVDNKGIRKCPRCKSIFIVTRKDKKFCSSTCRARYCEAKKEKEKR